MIRRLIELAAADLLAFGNLMARLGCSAFGHVCDESGVNRVCLVCDQSLQHCTGCYTESPKGAAACHYCGLPSGDGTP